MSSVLMVVSTSGNLNFFTIRKQDGKPIQRCASENSFRAEDDDEYCFVQRGEGLGASVDCQVEPATFHCEAR